MDGLTRRAQTRRGTSYLEVSLAIVILALCILPAARYLPGLLANQRELEAVYQLSLIAQEKLEAACLDLDADFAERDDSGDLSAQGHPDWRYHLVVTIPLAADGRYAELRSEAWVDENGNATLDPDEPQVRYDTLAANRQWGP